MYDSTMIFFLLGSCKTETISFAPPTSLDKDQDDTAKVEVMMVQDALDAFAKYACQSCHGDAGGFGLHLNSLKDGVSTTGMPYVTKGEPLQSYVYLKISNPDDIEGEIMPMDPDNRMTDDDIETIYLWIEQGAQGL